MDTREARARIAAVEGFVFDMDGTLVLGNRDNAELQLLPGALETLQELRNRGLPFVIFTNGTVRTPAHYARVLAGLGFPVADGDVFTPVSAAIDVFRERGYDRIMVLGGPGTVEPIRAAGFTVVDRVIGSGADAVLASGFRELQFTDLEAACDAVWAGANPYTASMAKFFATSEGRILSTSRTISAVIRDLTGRDPVVVGKPSRVAMEAAAHRMGVSATRTAVVGDDPALEMAMAHAAGALSIGVGTGILDDSTAVPDEQRPQISLDSVGELRALLP